MTLAMPLADRAYQDEEYDVFAVMDSVPMVVRGLDVGGSRFWSIFSAFVGVSSAYMVEGAGEDVACSASH